MADCIETLINGVIFSPSPSASREGKTENSCEMFKHLKQTWKYKRLYDVFEALAPELCSNIYKFRPYLIGNRGKWVNILYLNYLSLLVFGFRVFARCVR